MSIRCLCPLVLALAAVALAPMAIQSQGPPPGAPGAAEVVLLQSGQVLQGAVERVGDRFRVVLPHGEVRIPAASVRMRAASRLEIYRRLRAAGRNTAKSHLQLAEWCLQQRMHSQAAEQLSAARQLHPDHPRIALLQRRLELAAVEAPQAEAPEATADGRTASGRLRGDQLTAMVRQLPDEAVEQFGREMQLLLINSCAANRCHGGRGGNDFQLFRPTRQRVLTRRFTERNLESILQFLDRDASAQSPFLRQAGQPHGELAEPPLDEQQLRMLSQWTRLLAAAPPPARSDSQPQPASPRLASRPAAPKPPPPPAAVAEPPQGDPFDPAPFNERFHSNKR